jgi:hypothetical protein
VLELAISIAKIVDNSTVDNHREICIKIADNRVGFATKAIPERLWWATPVA